MRKSEKLKKIQLLLNQKNLYEDQYERLLAATGDWKSNYTDYLITEPIDLVEELKRVPEADYELCTALLTMLVKEEIPENASDKTFVDHKGLFLYGIAWSEPWPSGSWNGSSRSNACSEQDHLSGSKDSFRLRGNRRCRWNQNRYGIGGWNDNEFYWANPNDS